MEPDEFKVGQIVRIGFPGHEGMRGEVVEVVGRALYAVAYASGLADVYASGWLSAVEGGE